jgi:DNA-binding NtrC family response regulator
VFDFPGNVRQLENICHWLTVMAPAQVVESKDLPPELQVSGAVRRPRERPRRCRRRHGGRPLAAAPSACRARHTGRCHRGGLSVARA